MYYDKDLYEPFPDVRDPFTGEWLPPSESYIANIERSAHEQNQINADAMNLLKSVLK